MSKELPTLPYSEDIFQICSILHDLELCNALFVVHTNAEHLHQVSHEGGGGGREGTVETVIEEFKRRSNQPLCRTMGTCDTGGGQTEHPGGGQVRTWSRGGGGRVSCVQDYGNTGMQDCRRWAI